MKQKIPYIVFGLTAVVGFGMLIWGLWFQTEGFTLEYVSSLNIVAAAVIGFAIALLVMRYLLKMRKECIPHTQKPKLKEKDLKKMIWAYVICCWLCMLMLYTAQSIAFFLLAEGVIVLALASIWIYFIDLLIAKKKAEHAD